MQQLCYFLISLRFFKLFGFLVTKSYVQVSIISNLQAEDVTIQGVLRDFTGGPLATAHDTGTGAQLEAITVRWHPPVRGPVPAGYRVVLLLLIAGGNTSTTPLAQVPHAGSRYMLQVLLLTLITCFCDSSFLG